MHFKEGTDMSEKNERITSRGEIFRHKNKFSGNELVVMQDEASGELIIRIDHHKRTRSTATGRVVYTETGVIDYGKTIFLEADQIDELVAALHEV
jgi:hypothetical protein